MATSFKYRFGKTLGKILIFAYLLAAAIGITGSGFGLGEITTLTGWKIWAVTIPAGLLILRFVPRPLDILLLTPLAFWGVHKTAGLDYLPAGLIVGLPAALVVLLSIGQK